MDKSKGCILITPRSLSKNGHEALQTLEKAGFSIRMPWPGTQPNEAQLLEELPSCVGYLAGVEPISAKVLEAATHLRIISRNGVGIDNIDLEAAERLHIAVQGTPGANSQGVAELALGLMLDGFRSVTYSSAILKKGDWSRRIGSEVQGKTLGIIGCGNIGQRFAKMAMGIGMDVIAYDMYHSEEMERLEHFSYVELDYLLAHAHVVSLHCPPGETPLLNSQTLSTVKKGVIIVNTARDALVDHAAMVAALDRGSVAVYATDVYNKEPVELDTLYAHDYVILTPHIGGYTKESVERSTVAAVDNIVRYFEKNS